MIATTSSYGQALPEAQNLDVPEQNTLQRSSNEVSSTVEEELSLQSTPVSDESPWLDTMHRSVSESVNDTARWFDQFFMIDEPKSNEQAVGEARLKLGWRPRSNDLNVFESRFKVRVRLPNLKNRVDLVLSDYDDEQPDTPLQYNQLDSQDQQDRFSLALQWRRQADSGLSHRIGIGRRLQPFVKSRYRQNMSVGERADLRAETSLYYYSNDGFGAELALAYSYAIKQNSLFRFNNNFYFRDNSNDWLWQHSWQHLWQYNPTNAVINGLYIEGLSQPSYHLEEYLISSRWRQSTAKAWLFYEIEPFLTWRRDENFKTSYGIALRIEGYFGNI
jgi:hypothetical protein